MNNKILEVQLCDNTLPMNTVLPKFLANPDTGMVCLNDIYELGNRVRELRGYSRKSLRDFIRSKSVVEFLISLEKKENITMGASHSLEFDSKGRVLNIEELNLKYFHTREGINGGTWTHPLVALKALGNLDTDIEVLAYEQLYTLGIMGQRIDSSDSFKELNTTYRNCHSWRVVNSFEYSNIANAVADKVGMPKKPKGQKDFNRWNSATAEQLGLRSMIQDNLVYLLETKQILKMKEVLIAIYEMEID